MASGQHGLLSTVLFAARCYHEEYPQAVYLGAARPQSSPLVCPWRVARKIQSPPIMSTPFVDGATEQDGLLLPFRYGANGDLTRCV